MTKAPTKTWRYARVVSVVVAGTAGIAVGYHLLLGLAYDPPASRSEFGDSFGGLNAVLSAFATAGVVYALFQQQRQLVLQRESLDAQRDALTVQSRELELQRRELELQRREFALQSKAMQASSLELRKSAEAHARQIDVMKETAAAARAQVASFGAQGVERFLVQARSLILKLERTTSRLKVYLSGSDSEEFERELVTFDIDALRVELPLVPIFCSSPRVVQKSKKVQDALSAAILDLLNTIDSIRLAISLFDAKEWGRATFHRSLASNALRQVLMNLRSQTDQVLAIEAEAASWFDASQSNTSAPEIEPREAEAL